MATPESILIERSTRGDLGAFSDLVRMHQSGIRAYLVVRLGDRAEADDLAQEVFVTAYNRLETLKEGQPFGAWLRRIALNHYRNHRRKFRAAPVGDSADLQGLLDQRLEAQFSGVAEPAVFGVLRECLDQLEGPSRSILNERYLAGRTVRELAQSTGRGYSALTMQLHRLRTTLAECIRHKLPGESPS